MRGLKRTRRHRNLIAARLQTRNVDAPLVVRCDAAPNAADECQKLASGGVEFQHEEPTGMRAVEGRTRSGWKNPAVARNDGLTGGIHQKPARPGLNCPAA